ncbi:MAG: hypothetical protein KatS3mg087_1067 [Patescibacteria group bacterium]|nr:MAG: hypothetical protein KatS3mg087_1067 [Patescibacteria group bacterium]
MARVLRLLELRVLSVCTKADIRRLEKAYRIPVTIVKDLRLIACFGSQEFHILDNPGQYKIPRSLVTSRYKSFYYRQSPHQEYCREYKWDFADSRQVFDNVVAELFSSREAQTN